MLRHEQYHKGRLVRGRPNRHELVRLYVARNAGLTRSRVQLERRHASGSTHREHLNRDTVITMMCVKH